MVGTMAMVRQTRDRNSQARRFPLARRHGPQMTHKQPTKEPLRNNNERRGVAHIHSKIDQGK
jgi:hypothetical protein